MFPVSFHNLKFCMRSFLNIYSPSCSRNRLVAPYEQFRVLLEDVFENFAGHSYDSGVIALLPRFQPGSQRIETEHLQFGRSAARSYSRLFFELFEQRPLAQKQEMQDLPGSHSVVKVKGMIISFQGLRSVRGAYRFISAQKSPFLQKRKRAYRASSNPPQVTV
jgi:hypothetical protein